ncbi:unnamed protein product [Cuscuta epithymum]|uniref:Putative plant transposon protein domain-containing protein n=1 Tax=Cuscuta epithymum TaxID=186058 RepID=A0AAV0FAN5_9ASTE|nr:unnamed protein product [Cuscuta epithymum]
MKFINITDLSEAEAKALVANIATGMKVDMSSLPLLAENQKTMKAVIAGMNDSQLTKIVAHPYEQFSTLDVAEFYLNAHITDDAIHSQVQGKSLKIDADALNEFFNIELDSQDEDTPTLIDLESVEVSVETFVDTYCRPDATGVDKLYMKKNLFKRDYEKLMSIMHRCLWCKTSSTDQMNNTNAKALYAVHHGMNINWGKVLYKSLTESVEKKDKKTGLFTTKIGHGLLLSKVISKSQVELRNPSTVDHSKTIFLTASPKVHVAIAAELKREERLEQNREKVVAKSKPALTKPKKKSQTKQEATTEKVASEENASEAGASDVAPIKKLKQKKRRKAIIQSDSDASTSPIRVQKKKKKKKTNSPPKESEPQGGLASELANAQVEPAPEVVDTQGEPELAPCLLIKRQSWQSLPLQYIKPLWMMRFRKTSSQL